MTVHDLIASVVVVTTLGCGAKPAVSGHGDGGLVTGDAHGSDAGLVATSTDVMGVLGGSPFDLKFGAVMRAVSGDPRNWICAANIQVTFDQCQMSAGPTRIMFLGPFVHDQSGVAKWDLAETSLYRVGPSALTKLAVNGTINIEADDAATGELRLTLNVDFGESPTTSGAFAYVP